jgi:hypothetical protein
MKKSDVAKGDAACQRMGLFETRSQCLAQCSVPIKYISVKHQRFSFSERFQHPPIRLLIKIEGRPRSSSRSTPASSYVGLCHAPTASGSELSIASGISPHKNNTLCSREPQRHFRLRSVPWWWGNGQVRVTFFFKHGRGSVIY